MKSLMNILLVAAFACLGFLFYVVIRGAANAPESFSGGGVAVIDNGPVKPSQPVVPSEVQAQYDAGEKLFKQNCSACHKLNGKLVGPQLKGINEKYAGDEEWLYAWIRNAPSMIKKGDKKALDLWNQYNQQAMTAFPQLTDENIKEILVYVKYGG